MSSSPTSSSYWCYRCTRFVAVSVHEDDRSGVTCPHCNGGFVEQIQTNNQSVAAAADRPSRIPAFRFRRTRRHSGDRSPFNPVVVLRGSSSTATPENSGSAEEGGTTTGNYEFYYDDGTGSGLRPVPATMSEFLMGSGFDRLLDQLTQIEMSTLTRHGNPPASKSAVESMPALKISEMHVGSEANCAVCTEEFGLGAEAREMPCKHIFHSDCILPWLAIRNSCPVCRHELPVDQEMGEGNSESSSGAAEEIVGLTIWRLPGGGFAVGRFRGGAERARELPVPGVLTEVDGGGFGGGSSGSGGVVRRVSWVSSSSSSSRRRARGESSGSGGRGGLGRVFRGLVSFVRRIGTVNNDGNNSDSDLGSESSSSHYGSSVMSRSWSQSSNGFGRFLGSGRRRRGFDLEVENGTADRW